MVCEVSRNLRVLVGERAHLVGHRGLLVLVNSASGCGALHYYLDGLVIPGVG
jgi:hypothetical protein